MGLRAMFAVVAAGHERVGLLNGGIRTIETTQQVRYAPHRFVKCGRWFELIEGA